MNQESNENVHYLLGGEVCYRLQKLLSKIMQVLNEDEEEKSFLALDVACAGLKRFVQDEKIHITVRGSISEVIEAIGSFCSGWSTVHELIDLKKRLLNILKNCGTERISFRRTSSLPNQSCNKRSGEKESILSTRMKQASLT